MLVNATSTNYTASTEATTHIQDEYDKDTPTRELSSERCSDSGCEQRSCRFHCKKCDRIFCHEHAEMHILRGEFVPSGYGSGVHKMFQEDISSDESDSDKENSSGEQKEESDTESSSDTW